MNASTLTMQYVYLPVHNPDQAKYSLARLIEAIRVPLNDGGSHGL
jgi:hypothetical protein